jgi:ribonuclease VapC
MVIDSSALVAIMLGEPSRAALITEVVRGETVIAAPSLLETHMVLKMHFGDATGSQISQTLREFDIQVVEFTPDQAVVATRAFDEFGKGRHPASLNFGDCIAYALAKTTHQRLLFVGQDFSQTDVRPALVLTD